VEGLRQRIHQPPQVVRAVLKHQEHRVQAGAWRERRASFFVWVDGSVGRWVWWGDEQAPRVATRRTKTPELVPADIVWAGTRARRLAVSGTGRSRAQPSAPVTTRFRSTRFGWRQPCSTRSSRTDVTGMPAGGWACVVGAGVVGGGPQGGSRSWARRRLTRLGSAGGGPLGKGWLAVGSARAWVGKGPEGPAHDAGQSRRRSSSTGTRAAAAAAAAARSTSGGAHRPAPAPCAAS
jgi:hypothetical protein